MYRAKAALLFFVVTSGLALLVTALGSLTPSLLRIYLEYREVAAFTGNTWLVDKVKAADRYDSAAEWVLPYEANGRALRRSESRGRRLEEDRVVLPSNAGYPPLASVNGSWLMGFAPASAM